MAGANSERLQIAQDFFNEKCKPRWPEVQGITALELMELMKGESILDWGGCALLDARPVESVIVLSGEKSSSPQVVVLQSSCFRLDVLFRRGAESSLGFQDSPVVWGSHTTG